MRNPLLRTARRTKGWTQQHLADFAEVSLSTVERAERGESIRIDSVQRLCKCLQKTPEQLGLLSKQSDYAKANDSIIIQSNLNSDYLSILENEMLIRWSLYHTGGTNLVSYEFDKWMQHVAKTSMFLQGDDLYERSLTILSMGYQLQGSVLRDMRKYAEAHIIHRKASLIAETLFNPELIASALVREGITLNQEERPLDAITCFTKALETIKNLGYTKLEGYIYQALSEAQAKIGQEKESWQSISLAEKSVESKPLTAEINLTRLNSSSLSAQRGVNAVYLGDYKQAIDQIDKSLAKYNPTIVRGRARLLIQKAKSYMGLGSLDSCVQNAQEALMLANSIGSSRIINNVKELHDELRKSKWRKEQYVVDLGNIISEDSK
ncbi:helix-turn-helix domain-containing protein [Thermoactinomyces sp. DSM 45892]|uniref:helix-turn-helix domain-containing protein n=1 Tax=Thermoactinomyces sp. DSM 45892 TaxID=1882753 RepID=UPI0008954339|nr:helix-turn-helix domain-containing protein [Thermoactinomyces sp. DSM 45892]SDZ37971.1 Helix-turn-helix domain-containing protein [Thermoactinomyces sp. DSM 45892]